MTKRILFATLVVGILDIGEVIVFYGLKGIAPISILQSVAVGLLGHPAAREGGWPTAFLGLGLHFFIAFCVVAVYFLASRKMPALHRAPLLSGALYGIGVYLVMNFIVVPLSAAGPPRFTTVGVLNQLFAHLFCVGIPTALFAKSAMVAAPQQATP